MPLDEEPLERAVYDAPGPRRTPVRETVQPTSSPAPSSNPGTVGGTPGADGEQAAEPEQKPADEEEQQEADLPEFDPQYRDAFNGLLFVGALSDQFDWLGHRFHIRTLTTGELAEVALLAKPYAGSEAALKAWQAATVAAALVTVDGKEIAIPLTSEIGDTHVAAKFRYVMDKWFPPVLDAIYERYIRLELQVRDVISAMGKASG